MHWESYLAMNGSAKHTMEEDTKLFRKKIMKLNDIWDKLKSSVDATNDNVLTRLQDKAEKILNSVEKEGSLNAGGKFEWVDSILIKCLQDGSWLLIDNVNLCSSAVLDRLNALLEPHGVLTISERGVDQNGQMIEIKPHKDFRLFLTMDPKNGEISRAMRNRGVEIYILNENESNVPNEFDKKSLISLEGLKKSDHIKSLLKIHDFISDLTLGEKPHINEILQASSLISQQINHGVEVLEAFSSTVIEVYYKTRLAVEFNCNDAESVIREEIKRTLNQSLRLTVNLEADLYSDHVTLKTQNIETCSMVEKIKQQSAILQTYISGNEKNKNVTINLLLNVYSITSLEDLETRHICLKNSLNDLNAFNFLDKLYNIMSNLKNTECETLPLDNKWIPETSYKIKNSSQSNKLNLALHIAANYFKEETEVNAIKNNNLKEKKVTLLDYMHEKQKRKVEDKFGDIIINEYLTLVTEYDEYLNNISEKIDSIEDESVIKVLYLIFWRFAFHRCTLINIKDISTVEQYNTVINLTVHYKWFLKFAIRQIASITKVSLPKNLEERISEINNKLEKQFSFIQKIGKNYQRCSNTPPPYTNVHQLEVMPVYNEISNCYNLYENQNDYIKIISILKKDKELRPLLVELKSELDYDFTDASKKITLLKSLHEKLQNTSLETRTCNFEVQVLPIEDYITHLILKDIMKTVPKIEDPSAIMNDILIPTELIGALLRYSRTKDVRLLHEITKCFYLYLMNSPSIKPIKYLKGSLDDQEELNLSGINPRLTFYLTSLLIGSSETHESGIIKLGNFSQLMKQHDRLRLILWRNLYQLSEENYDYLENEKAYIIRIFKIFIIQLAEFLNIDNTNGKTLQEISNQCVNVIEEMKSHSSLIDRSNDTITFIKHLKKCTGNITKLANNSNVNKTLLVISDLYMELSYIKATLNSKLSLIDPLAKKALKKKYCLETIDFFKDIKKCYEHQNKLYSNTDDTIHAYYIPVSFMIEELEAKNEELGKYVAVRPKDVLYETVLRVVNHAFATILSENHITKTSSTLSYHILNTIDAISHKEDIDYRHFTTTLNQYESTVISYENLIREWNNFRNSYPDIVEPLLSNIAEFLYGFKMKLSLFKKVLGEYKYMKLDVNINTEVVNFVKFPVMDDGQDSYYKHIEAYTSKRIINFINHVLESGEFPHIKKQENFRLLKCGIQECFNLCILDAKATDILSKNLFMKFNELVNTFVIAWNKQQEEKEIKQKEAKSLYKTRSKCDDKSEEEQINEELKELFPNYHEIDFLDVQKYIEMEERPKEQQPEDQYKGIISYQDLQFVIQLHMNLVQNFTKTEWLNPSKNKSISYDFIQPLLEKHKVFKQILDKSVHFLDYTMDSKLVSSFNVLLAVTQAYGETSHLCEPSSPSKLLSKKNRDFYKDPNVDEVKSCYHILEELRLRINELLKEWPDQPTLKTIISVIERIYNFDIASPLSRFLTGFEILLSKCHEWEEVAHSGVSLSQYYQNITQQIIHWRKLELAMWKDLLNRTYERLNEPLAKWWLYMYNIMEQFIVEKLFTERQLIETLQTFITKSNLAEFQGRLDILYAFHCHATYLYQSRETKLFVNILWNVYSYFQQYTLTVSNKIKDLRSPIEKKLKDYVKIVTWKDINYWAIKETVDKSHKTLHKYMREFQDVLQQPVSSYLVNINNRDGTQNIGIWDRPQRHSPKTYHYTLDAEAYMAKQSLIKKIQFGEPRADEGILSKIESYFLKSRKLCKETILALNYPNLVQTLDSFATEVIETSSHLQNLEVDTSLPKEKQRSQAKHILQQKHRALADLFKSLSKIGLSFRTGIIEAKLKDPSTDFIIRPIDLSANFSHINHGRKEEKILTIWDSCEMYYVRSLMRIDVLETTLKNPAKDLGLQNIERCKGFTAHLMILAQKEKSALINSTRTYYYLRFYAKQLNDYCEGKEFLPIDIIDNTRELLKNIFIIMDQCKIILNSCPLHDNFSNEIIEVPLLKSKFTERIEYKNDDAWSSAMSLINNILSTNSKLTSYLQKSKGNTPSVEYELAYPEFVPISDLGNVESDLIGMYKNLDSLKQLFGDIAINDSLTWLMKEITLIGEQFEKRHSGETQYNEAEFKKEVERFAEKNLIVMQNLYKKHVTTSTKLEEKTKDVSEESIEEDKLLEEEHLKTLLIENLSSDISALEMKKILKATHKIAGVLLRTPPHHSEPLKSLVYQCLPLLEQTVQLYQYFITQQVSAYRVLCKLNSILLNIFIDLASKGFCVPPEFSEDMDSEGVSKPSDGLGLGEGEGERDVSDKIESEDQLDDAQPAGQEKEKEEDKDCKEEEKGIEMSEDFESKLQDKEKKDDDDDTGSDDSDANEQMGETEKGADQLDQQIWGSDKEDDDDGDEESDKKDERGDNGEKEGEDQLAAKENTSPKNDFEENNEKNTAEEKEKSKKDINEIDEPEYDDDQIDPHHGNQPELPEPEPMDLPDDLQLDEGQENDNEGENQEENPFDIDTQKEQNMAEEKTQEDEDNQEDKAEDEEKDFSSEDEEITRKDVDNTDENKTEEDTKDQSEIHEAEEEETENKDSGKTDETDLDHTQTNQENVEAMEVDNAEATDKTEASQSETQAANQPIDELCQEDRPDKEGVGQSQMEESKTGHSAQTITSQEVDSAKLQFEEDQMKKQKPGQSDSKRSLGETTEPVKKKLKTVDATEREAETEENRNNTDETAEMYQHIKEAKETTTQILDVATKEQAEQQKKEVPNKEDEEAAEPTESSEDLPVDEEPENVDMSETPDEVSQKTETSEKTKDKKTDKRQHPEGDILENIQDVEIEGDVIETTMVPRSTESTHHTLFGSIIETTAARLSVEEINNLRSEVENQLSAWNEPPTTTEADQLWQKISSVTASLAQDLSEQLRLVLEPTQASRLKGDFRSGRRINMRKVIPYIASQFRKDKIWLRRTKPSKREYDIVLAIDDSSSMADNHSKELAFESVSLISKALTLLESGQLSVISFGENIEVLHKLTDQFTDRSGVKLLQKFRFDQNKTCVAKLVDFATEMLNQSHVHSSALIAKLLIIVSDGRGVFSEGETYVRQAVRRAKLSNIFMVFVIIDNPENKNSILDIRMPVFKDGKLLGIQAYMDVFPFSFYIILRDINSLPSVLSDALRQWFEIVSNMDKQ